MTKSDINIHIQITHEDVCNQCDKSYGTESNINVHIHINSSCSEQDEFITRLASRLRQTLSRRSQTTSTAAPGTLSTTTTLMRPRTSTGMQTTSSPVPSETAPEDLEQEF